MNRGGLLILALFFYSLGGAAQANLKYYEFGLGLGTLTSSNDIATTSSVSSVLNEARPSARVYGVYHLNDWFGFGGQFDYGWMYQADANHTNVSRGLENYTTMTQVNAFIEMNFIRFGKFHRETKFGIYTKLGGGYLAYNPHLTFTNLQPSYIDVFPDSYTANNYFITLGLKFRTSYKGILRAEAYFHSMNKDNIEGFELNSGGALNPINDSYGGVMISYSVLIF